MMRVSLCIAQEHDLNLVALALLVCLIGSAAAIQLFRRIKSASGDRRLGWVLLAGVGTGTMVWSTHFVAMMAFRTGAPVVLDPVLTLMSLVVAITLAAPGLALAAGRRGWSGLAGGGIIGVAISAMHYLGMTAYRIDGIVTWEWHYVAASVLLAVVLAAAAFHILAWNTARGNLTAGGLLGLAVVALHFTGMAAMDITVLKLGGGLSDLTLTALAIATAVAALIVVGCAAVSALIDGQTQTEAYRHLRFMALHDGLTGLPNRMSFIEELARRLAVKGGYPSMAVVALDLSRFKVVNDTYGHQAGDHVLIAIAARLSAMLQPGEYVARLGGDEFAALISYREASELRSFLNRFAGAFEDSFEVPRLSLSIGANIGVALAIKGGCNADSLLAEADLAMYRAKFEHSAEPCFYDAQMDDAVRADRELAGDLRDAVRAGGFKLHFQVQASIATGGGH